MNSSLDISNKKSNNFLSVIIPNYNHGKYLKETLPGILKQSRLPDEVIIIDDGSSDNSVEIIEDFANKNSIIKFYKNEKNCGVVYTLNKALNLSRGDYVTFPSADNFILEGMYEKTLSLLNLYPHAALCCSDPLFLNEATGQIRLQKLSLSASPKYFSSGEVVSLARKKKFSIGNVCHTVIVKRRYLLEAGIKNQCFIPEMEWHCDFFALNAIAFRYGFCYLPQGFAVFRISSNSYCNKNYSWDKKKAVYESLFNTLDLPCNSDVKSCFKKTAILMYLSPSVLRFVFKKFSYFQYLTPLLIYRFLYKILGTFMRKNLLMRMKNLKKNVRQRVKRYIYG